MGRRNKGLLQVLVGTVVLAVCTLGQDGHSLTPFLARYPGALAVFGNAGVGLLMTAAAVSLWSAVRSASRCLYALSVAYLLLAAFCQLNLYGCAFQLGVAALTVGGGLITLGSINALSTKNKRA